MGNKFSNKTQVNLRPKVCGVPPPPPLPGPIPTVPTACCPSNPTKKILGWIVTAAGCPAMLPLQGNVIWVEPAGPTWEGQFNWPDLTLNPVTWKLRCDAGTLLWMLASFYNNGNDMGQVVQGRTIDCVGGTLEFKMRMQTGDLPGSCSGSAARNWTVKFF